MNEKFEEQAREYLEKELIKEDYCPHCREHSRMVKVFDCSDRWWRCFGCMGLSYSMSLPIQSSKVERYYRDHPSAADLKAYLKVVEAQEKKEEEQKKARKAQLDSYAQ